MIGLVFLGTSMCAHTKGLRTHTSSMLAHEEGMRMHNHPKP